VATVLLLSSSAIKPLPYASPGAPSQKRQLALRLMKDRSSHIRQPWAHCGPWSPHTFGESGFLPSAAQFAASRYRPVTSVDDQFEALIHMGGGGMEQSKPLKPFVHSHENDIDGGSGGGGGGGGGSGGGGDGGDGGGGLGGKGGLGLGGVGGLGLGGGGLGKGDGGLGLGGYASGGGGGDNEPEIAGGSGGCGGSALFR